MTTTLVELCAGTASVSLRVLAGRPMQPLTGYMGSKRRWASQLAHLLTGGGMPDRVLLVDAGPWGDVWEVLREREHRRAVANVLRHRWGDRDAHELWAWLVTLEPSQNPVDRIAQYLWLQARSAGTIPIWWNAERSRWESPTGSRTETAHERGGAAAHNREVGDHRVGRAAGKGSRLDGPAYEAGGLARHRAEEGSRKVSKAQPKESVDASRRQKSTPNGSRGVQYPATIAHRVDCLDLLPWERVEVIRADLREIDPIPSADVYFDPPYAGCPRYAAVCPRRDVLDVAERWASAGCRVLVSEGEALPIEGWHHARLADREWLTASWPISLPEQLSLPGVAA
jgi:hypothetical protein